MVHKESQQVPGIKIKSYILGFSKHIDILGEIMHNNLISY